MIGNQYLFNKYLPPTSDASSSSGSSLIPGREIDTDQVKDAFECINFFGIDTVLDLCTKKLNGTLKCNEMHNSIKYLCLNKSVQIDWLFELDEISIAMLFNSIKDFKNPAENILAAFKPKEWGSKETDVFESNIVIGTISYQLMFSRQGIFLKNDDSNEKIQLMNVVQLLTMCKAHLRGLDLSNLDLRGLNLSELDLCGTNFSRSILIGVDMSRSDLSDADLSRADMCKANLSSAILRNANLTKATLRMANLYKVTLLMARLRKTDLHSAYMYKVDMRGAYMFGAILTNANMSQTLLGNANMSCSILNGANMAFSDLSWTNLEGASLVNACLSSAYLGATNLGYANMSWADLTGSNMCRTILTGTNLNCAVLHNVKLLDAQFDFTTILEDTAISLNLPEEWKRQIVNDKQSHLRKIDSAKLFLMINTMNKKYSTLQNKLKLEITNALMIEENSENDEVHESDEWNSSTTHKCFSRSSNARKS